MSVAFGVGGWVWNSNRADDYEARLAAKGCAAGSPSGVPSNPNIDCSEFVSERASLRRMDTIVQAVGFSSVAVLGLAGYLFLQGPPTGIYDRYKPARGAASMAVAPLSGGGLAAVVTGAF